MGPRRRARSSPEASRATGSRPAREATGGWLVAEATIRVDAPSEAVWARWLDVEARPRWHPRLEWARLEGPPALGARGAWKPVGTRPVSVLITEITPHRRLVLRGTHGPPVARGHYEHELQPLAGGGSLVTHRMRLTGPMALPIGWLLGRALGAFATPAALAAFAALVPAPADAMSLDRGLRP